MKKLIASATLCLVISAQAAAGIMGSDKTEPPPPPPPAEQTNATGGMETQPDDATVGEVSYVVEIVEVSAGLIAQILTLF